MFTQFTINIVSYLINTFIFAPLKLGLSSMFKVKITFRGVA